MVAVAQLKVDVHVFTVVKHELANVCPLSLGLVDFVVYVFRSDDGQQRRARPMVDREGQDLEEAINPKGA